MTFGTWAPLLFLGGAALSINSRKLASSTPAYGIGILAEVIAVGLLSYDLAEASIQPEEPKEIFTITDFSTRSVDVSPRDNHVFDKFSRDNLDMDAIEPSDGYDRDYGDEDDITGTDTYDLDYGVEDTTVPPSDNSTSQSDETTDKTVVQVTISKEKDNEDSEENEDYGR